MAAEEPHHPDASRIELVQVLAALGHPVRLEIVRALAAGELTCCGEVVPGLPRSSVTHHVRALREAGVIRQRREGRKLFLTLRAEDLDLRFPGLLAMAVNASAPRTPPPAPAENAFDFPGPGPSVGLAP
ncbi:ArsR/SmtB family transcription factor [Streptomyces sp. NPDC002990]